MIYLISPYIHNTIISQETCIALKNIYLIFHLYVKYVAECGIIFIYVTHVTFICFLAKHQE